MASELSLTKLHKPLRPLAAGKCKLCEPKKPADETRSLVLPLMTDTSVEVGQA